ncbi:MAG TPA: MerR family transcriptional regulator [Longimicrobiales bacterium]|nr:MerR family transcriptional regulator [Longimicrobiales bacterium]
MSDLSSAGDTDPGARGGVAVETVSRPKIQKEYYSIGEVCTLVDLKPHVLRYWESQFPALNPGKNRSGNRVYRRKEIRLILLVKHLLYREKYTIEGARQKLEQLRRDGEIQDVSRQAVDADLLDSLRRELTLVLQDLTLDEVT